MSTTTVRQDKDANAKLDYVFNWEAFVDADSDSIASAQVIVPSGLGCTGTTVTASTVQVFVSGGTEGTTYALINRIWTTGGRREDKTLELTITQSPSGSHTIVVEDGTGKTDATSYVSVSDANTILSSHLYASAWHQSTDAEKEKALSWASRLLDEHMVWYGTRTNETQALQWPRLGTKDRGGWAIDGDEIPQDLKNATAELARLLLTEDRTAEEDTLGFRRLKVGSIDIEIDKYDRQKLVPDQVIRSLSPLGYSAAGGTSVRLVRT